MNFINRIFFPFQTLLKLFEPKIEIQIISSKTSIHLNCKEIQVSQSYVSI